ncbi:hypothetical protein G6F23_014902 [Rhizopus arrhizus]|nr:hypothetical protein G6F23_014902 [Rhizopus arrhizus]
MPAVIQSQLQRQAIAARLRGGIAAQRAQDGLLQASDIPAEIRAAGPRPRNVLDVPRGRAVRGLPGRPVGGRRVDHDGFAVCLADAQPRSVQQPAQRLHDPPPRPPDARWPPG